MGKIKACIFDLDGVIVDTAKYHYLAWKRLAKELGFEFTEEQNERLKGVSRIKSLEILLEIGKLSFSEEDKLKLAEKKNKWYVEYIRKMKEDEVLEGAREFIELVRKNGMKTALGSVSKNSMIILNNLKLTGCFDAIIDGNKVTRGKPDPEVFLLGAEEMNISSRACVVFEDSKAGVEAAINAHMKVIGIGKEENLIGANFVVKSLKDMSIEKLEELGEEIIGKK